MVSRQRKQQIFCPGGEDLGGIVVQFCPDEELSDGTRDRTLVRHTVEELFGICISFVQSHEFGAVLFFLSANCAFVAGWNQVSIKIGFILPISVCLPRARASPSTK